MGYVKGYIIHIDDAYIRFNLGTTQPDVSHYNIDIMTGDRMTSVPEAYPRLGEARYAPSASICQKFRLSKGGVGQVLNIVI